MLRYKGTTIEGTFITIPKCYGKNQINILETKDYLYALLYVPGAYRLYAIWENNNNFIYISAKYTAISSTALNIVGDTIVLFNKYVVSINNGPSKNIAIVSFDTDTL